MRLTRHLRHTPLPPARRPSRRPAPPPPLPPARSVGGAVPTADDDLLQYEGREKWYVAPFAADDQPDWWAASVTRVDDVSPGAVKVVTLDVEASRERVPLRNAYVAVGQRARVRVPGGAEASLPVCSPPRGVDANHEALVAVRNDVRAGDTKVVRELTSLRVPVSVWVTPKGAPELWKVVAGDPVDVGPFHGTGADLKAIAGAFAYPTIVIFAYGTGIATVKALLTTAPADDALALHLRRSVTVFYRAVTASDIVWRDEFEAWCAAAAAGPGGKGVGGPAVRVRVSTRDSYADMFDGDDELEYDPATTAAIVVTGGDGEATADALAACEAAEITTIVMGDEDAPPVVHTDTAKVP